jgi:hypothetical protein
MKVSAAHVPLPNEAVWLAHEDGVLNLARHNTLTHKMVNEAEGTNEFHLWNRFCFASAMMGIIKCKCTTNLEQLQQKVSKEASSP